MRVTQGLMTSRVLANLNRQTRRIMALQEQLSTGLRVNRPSDDPVATRLGINTRTAIGRSEQYLANIQYVSPLLEETSTAIETAGEYIGRASELALQGANGTYSQAQLNNIAVEVNQLLEGLVATANHETNGRYVFAGNRTTNPPYAVTRNAAGEITAVTYQGNDEHIESTVGDGVQVVTNETGTDVFQSAQDAFQTLIALRDNLRTNNKNALSGPRLDELKGIKQQFLQSLARVGAVQNRLERLTDDTEGSIFEYQKLLSETIEADYTETLVNLNAQSNAYQAALDTAARVLQPSLLDFVE